MLNEQKTLFDLIEEITQVNLCECCKQPCENNIHKECADDWMDKIVMKNFKKDLQDKE